MPQLMRIRPGDNVAAALAAVPAGTPARENGGLPPVHRASCESVPAVL